MKNKNLVRSSVLLLITFGFNVSHAEKTTMKTYFDDRSVLPKEIVFLVKNPIRVRIRIGNTAEEIQKLHRVDLHVIYENPANSGEIGTWNKSLTRRDIGVFSEGQQIERGDWLPTEIKPKPLTDADFLQMQPGEKRIMDWSINLNELGMHEGKHQYELFLAGTHVPPSEKEKIRKDMKHRKIILSDGTQSNTVTFTYTKPPKMP